MVLECPRWQVGAHLLDPWLRSEQRRLRARRALGHRDTQMPRAAGRGGTRHPTCYLRKVNSALCVVPSSSRNEKVAHFPAQDLSVFQT